MKNRLPIFIFLPLLIACSGKENKEKVKEGFVFPQIVDSFPKAYLVLSPVVQSIVNCPVLGFGTSGDRKLLVLDEDSARKILDYDYQFDYRNYKEAKMSLLVDTLGWISKNPWDYIPPPPPWRNPDYVINDLHEGLRGLLIDSMRWADYYERRKDPSSFVKAYPVYLLNESDAIIHIRTYDGRLFLFQQAMDSLGKWRSIEFYRSGWCGNGVAAVKLKSKEYLCASVYEYTGTYKTRLRIAFKMFNDTIYSVPFEGSINYSQFDSIPSNKWLFRL